MGKNYLYRRRQYIVTTLEILLPTALAIVLAYSKAILTDDNYGYSDYRQELNEQGVRNGIIYSETNEYVCTTFIFYHFWLYFK